MSRAVLFYPITPMAAPRMSQRDKWDKRPVVQAYFAFRDEVRLQHIDIPIPCRVTFCMPMPGSWSHKKRLAMDGAPHTVRPDVDNLCKALLDSSFANDGHVWSIWPVKRWSNNPGILIEAINDDQYPPTPIKKCPSCGLQGVISYCSLKGCPLK